MGKRNFLDEGRRPKFRENAPEKPTHSKSTSSGPSPEVVFKVIHWHKAARAARDSAAYMGRLRPQDDLTDRETVYNVGNNPLSPSELKAELDGWGLREDERNLSPEAKKLGKADQAAMPESERLLRRQTVHATLSFPRDGGLTPDQIKNVSAQAFERSFGEKGHRYIYAVHDEGEHVHVHVLVKVEGREKRSRLRLGPKELDAIRRDAAEIANERYGTRYRATRRESRERTRSAVRAGAEPLRPKAGYREAKGQTPQHSWIKQKAPAWYDRHGADYERRRAGMKDGRQVPPPFPARLPKLSAKTNQALEQHFARYENPDQARQRFLEMAAESREYAYWAANKRPETFGAVKPGQAPAQSLNQARAPISRTWQTEARRRIAEANGQEWQKQPERMAARRQAAEQASKVARADRQEAGKRYAETVFVRRGHGAAPEAEPEAGGGQSIQPDRQEADGKRPWRDRLKDLFKKTKPKDETDGGGGQSMQPDRADPQRDRADSAPKSKKRPTDQEIDERAAAMDGRADTEHDRGHETGRHRMPEAPEASK